VEAINIRALLDGRSQSMIRIGSRELQLQALHGRRYLDPAASLPHTHYVYNMFITA